MTQHLSQLKALVVALELSKELEEGISPFGSEHRLEKINKALTHAPELLKHLEGMERAKEQLHNENIFFSKRYSVVSNAADLMREEIREYEKYFHEEAMEQVEHYDEVRKKQALEIPYYSEGLTCSVCGGDCSGANPPISDCPNPPKAGE